MESNTAAQKHCGQDSNSSRRHVKPERETGARWKYEKSSKRGKYIPVLKLIVRPHLCARRRPNDLLSFIQVDSTFDTVGAEQVHGENGVRRSPGQVTVPCGSRDNTDRFSMSVVSA